LGKTITITLAKELRRRQTEAEKILWFRLRNRQLDGAKFRRQQCVGTYVVDFINFEQKLVIEIDGGQHNNLITQEKDKQRTLWLQGEGYQVMRFWNNDITNNIEGVLENIRGVLNQ
jgi:very-short-patch-repair endonuclease